jgi:polar amino acid transport system permease protein
MDDSAPQSTTRRSHELRVVRTRHPSRWVLSALIVVVLAMLIHLLVTNKNLQWNIIGKYLHSEPILLGLLRTLELTALAMILGIAIGAVLAVMRLSTNPIIASVAWLYIWFFRGTPLLVQIIFWFNLALLVQHVSFGVPFGPEFISRGTNDIITPFTAAILALSLNEGAYMAEIVRAGLISVDGGQLEAAQSLGMTKRKTTLLIVFPQAMRVIVPPTGNQVIGMLKTTSLVSIIALPELLYSAQQIYSLNFETIPLLIVASIWYIVVSTVLTFGQFYIERHYARGSSRELPPTPLQRWRRRLHAVSARRQAESGTARVSR